MIQIMRVHDRDAIGFRPAGLTTFGAAFLALTAVKPATQK